MPRIPLSACSFSRRPHDRVPRCADYDEDCEPIEDKLKCWLYDPAKGYCPFLSSTTNVTRDRA